MAKFKEFIYQLLLYVLSEDTLKRYISKVRNFKENILRNREKEQITGHLKRIDDRLACLEDLSTKGSESSACLQELATKINGIDNFLEGNYSSISEIDEIPDGLTLQLYFNNSCNADCKFCAAGIAKNKSEEVTIPAKWLYEDLLPLYPHVTHIVPTMGELTYPPEGYEYCKFIHENYPGINLLVETNGILFKQKWVNLACDNLMDVHFSLNAINEEYYRKTVQDKKGIFPVIIKNFDYYLKVLQDNGLDAFFPSVSIVLNCSNFDTIEAFIKMCLERKIQYINIYFDCLEHVTDESRQPMEKATVTIMEIIRVLPVGNVSIWFELHLALDNKAELQSKVNQMDIEKLNEKYADIIYFASSLKPQAEIRFSKEKLKQEKGKIPFSDYAKVGGFTFRRKLFNGKTICENPWTNIRLEPCGNTGVCCALTPVASQNINNFMKNNKIDWVAYLNNPYRKKLKFNFQKQNYSTCYATCPCTISTPEAEFNSWLGQAQTQTLVIE